MDLRPLGGQLMLLNLLRRNLVHKKMANCGCELHRGQLPVLEMVSQHPGITQAEAAALLRVTPASIALSTKRLQRSGLIEKQSDPQNKRKNLLKATPAGVSAAAFARQCLDQVDVLTFGGFSQEELHTMKTFLNKMIDNLSSDGEQIPGFPFSKEDSCQCSKS
jgi:DNA-binding MarR family transcriptional regulator